MAGAVPSHATRSLVWRANCQAPSARSRADAATSAPTDTGTPRRAPARREQRGQHSDRGRLARAVRAEQAEDFSGRDRQGQAVDGELVAERAAQAFCVDDQTHCSPIA
jgi:hypothetical protein